MKFVSRFVSAGVETDPEGDPIELRIALSNLDEEDSGVEPGDILLFEGECFQVIAFEGRGGRVNAIRVVIHECFNAA